MKKNIINILFVIWILSFIIAASAAAVPQYINYQGVLRDTAGTLQNGNFTMTFKIYNAATGGTAVYNSGAQTVAVSNGLYSISLEATSAIFDGNDKWIETTVGSDIFSPRLKIQSVAYAIKADNATTAETISGIGVSTTAAASKLYPLDTSANFSLTNSGANPVINGINSSSGIGVRGVSSTGTGVSAESASGNALFIAGKIGALTGTGKCAWTGTIDSGATNSGAISNTAVTTSSIILLTVGHGASVAGLNTNGGIRVSAVTNGTSFTVSTMDGNGASAAIPFGYVIIN